MNTSTKTLLGLVLLVIGLGLAFWGYQMSNSVGSQINELVNGSPANQVMYRYIGGAVCAAIGLFLLVKK